MILGGDGKGQDFAPLAEPVRRHVRARRGHDRPRRAADRRLHWGRRRDLAMHATTLQAATRWCFERAQPDDAVR